MRLTLPFAVISLLAGSAAAQAQDRYSAGAAQLRGSQPAATVGRAVDPSRTPQRMLSWPGKVAVGASSPARPGPFMAASLSAAPAQPARLQQPAVAPRVAVVRPPAVARMAPPTPILVAAPAPTPARAAPPDQIIAAIPVPAPLPAATQAQDWPAGRSATMSEYELSTGSAQGSVAPPPFTPGPRAWDGARGPALPSSIYDPAPPMPAAVQSTPAPPAAVAAQPTGRGSAPAFSASGAQAQTTRRPAGSHAFAAAAGGVPTRQYSVHRKYGGTPDPIQMPADFFASAPSPDLAEPPPPVARRLSPDGKTSTQARGAAAQAAQAAANN